MNKTSTDQLWELIQSDECNTFEEDFTCEKCSNLMKDPMILSCGHHFCSTCSNLILNEETPVCPADQCGPITKSSPIPDKTLRRRIMNIKISCPYHSENCQWAGRILELEDHFEKCDYISALCEWKCGKQVKRIDVNQHKSNECPERIINCKFCGTETKYNNLKDHYDICPKIRLECPNLCKKEANIAREDMENHLSICPKVDEICPFHKLKVPRNEMDLHFQNNIKQHFLLYADQNKTSLEKNKQISDEVMQIKGQNIIFQETIRERFIEFQKNIESITEELMKVKIQLEDEVKVKKNISEDKIKKCISKSKILSQAINLDFLYDVLIPLNIKSMKLLYRASEHDFSSEMFHKNCDHKGATVVFIQSKSSNMFFGGYSSVSWTCDEQKIKNDLNVDNFLFSMDRKTKHAIFKDKRQNAIYGKKSHGPIFGCGHDLLLSNCCNKNSDSCSDFGFTYQLPLNIEVGSELARTYLAGYFSFKVEEYEVYRVSTF